MGINLKKWLNDRAEEVKAQFNTNDGGATAATVRANRTQPAVTPVQQKIQTAKYGVLANNPQKQSQFINSVKPRRDYVGETISGVLSPYKKAASYIKKPIQTNIVETPDNTAQEMRKLQAEAKSGTISRNLAASRINALNTTSNAKLNQFENSASFNPSATNKAGGGIINLTRNRKVAPVVSGMYRSAIGTGESAVGLYDTVTPGKGNSRLGQNLRRQGEIVDQSVKQNNYNQLAYKAGQAGTDVATFLLPGGAMAKGATTAGKFISKAPVIGSAVSKVNKAANAGNLAAKSARYLLSPTNLVNVASDTALNTGFRANRGQDINPTTLAIDAGLSMGMSGGIGLAGAGAKKAIKKTTQPATNKMKDRGWIRPSNLSDDEIYALQTSLQKRGGFIDDATYRLSQQAENKLGIDTGTPDGVMKAYDVIGQHRHYNTQRGVRNQAVRNFKQGVKDRLSLPSNQVGAIGKDVRPESVKALESLKQEASYIKKIRQPIEKELKEAQAEMDKYGTGYINDIDLAAKQAKAKARLDRAKEADWQNTPDKIRARKENGEAAFRAFTEQSNQIAATKANFDISEPWYKAREEIKNKYIGKFKSVDEFVNDFNTNEGIIPKDIKNVALSKLKNVTDRNAYIDDLTKFYNETKKATQATAPKTVEQQIADKAKQLDEVTAQLKQQNKNIDKFVKDTKNPNGGGLPSSDPGQLVKAVDDKLAVGNKPDYEIRQSARGNIYLKYSDGTVVTKIPKTIQRDLYDRANGQTQFAARSAKVDEFIKNRGTAKQAEPVATKDIQATPPPEAPQAKPIQAEVPQGKKTTASDPTQQVLDQNPMSVANVKKQSKRIADEKVKNEKINAEFNNKGAELPEYNTNKVSLLDKAFRSTRSIIERQGKTGKVLADMLQKQRDTKELWIRDIEKRIPTVQKLKSKEYENFVDATQGEVKPLNDRVKQAIKEWQAVHPEVRQRAVDAGLDVGDLGPNYYPHFIDFDKIYKNQNTMNKAINHLVKTGQAPNAEEAIKLLSYARDVSRNRRFGNLEASRIIDLPFYDKSKSSLGSYISGSADRVTKTEIFGKNDENALKLISKAGLEGADTEAMKNAFDVAVGAKQYNPTTSKISSGIRQFTTTTRLGLGALTNVSQNVNTGIVTGHLRTMGAMLKQLNPKERQYANDTGVISDAIINDLRHGFGQETSNNKFGKAVKFITAPGFKQVESFNRRVAAVAGKDYALRLAQKGDEATLRKLGVTGEIKNKTLTNSQQIQASRKIVEKTQFKVDPQDLPGWTDTPGGKLVAQFRTFSYNQGKFFSNEILKPMAKGNVMPMARLLAALPLGYGLYELRRNIDGRPEEENKTKVALSSFQKVGGAGLVLDLYQQLNPVGSKYLPSDRRVSMAVGAFGGPSVGTLANGVGAISEAIQRKRTPDDPSRLGGKVAVANNGDSYTDLTALSRFGMQQIPIVGTPTMNRVLPYKKQSDADVGKTQIASSKDDLKSAKLSAQKYFGFSGKKEEEIKALAKNGDQNAKDYLDNIKAMERGFNDEVKDLPSKLNKSAVEVLNATNRLTEYGKANWAKQANNNEEIKKSLKGWNNGKDVPNITNEVAKDWAEYQKDLVEGKISKTKTNDKKKSIIRKAYESSLSPEEKDILTSGVSKAELKTFIEQGIITNENVDKALAVEKQLYDAGILTKEYLASKLGLDARGYKYRTSSGRTSRKGGRSKSYSPTTYASHKDFNNKLRNMFIKSL